MRKTETKNRWRIAPSTFSSSQPYLRLLPGRKKAAVSSAACPSIVIRNPTTNPTVVVHMLEGDVHAEVSEAQVLGEDECAVLGNVGQSWCHAEAESNATMSLTKL